MKKAHDQNGVNERHQTFAMEYTMDWNATRAYQVAYPDASKESAMANGSRLIRDAKIKELINDAQKNLEQTVGISRAIVLKEHMKIAFCSVSDLHNTWIERKAFDQLTDDQKACIAEIQTQVKTGRDMDGKLRENEFIKVKLYDKQKALDAITKMLGYDEAIKVEVDHHESKEIKVTRASEYIAEMKKAV
jgi:phage terminase small subunit